MKSLLIIAGACILCLACVIAGFLVYNRSRGISITLSSEEVKRRDAIDSQRIEIEVVGGGQVRVAGVMMSIAEMERLGGIEGWKAGAGVSIVTDETTVYTEGIAVLDAIRRLGIEKVGFKTRIGDKKTAEPGATDNPDDTQRN